MNFFFRLQEYKVFLYRIFLAYLFYFFARLFFFFYNASLFEVTSVGEFLNICYHGLVFDTSAIIYVNSLFIVLSVFPFWINTSKQYQKVLKIVYFITNLLFYSLNFVDFIYYKYNFSRTTLAVLDVLKNEDSVASMLFRFLFTYWHVFLLYFLCALLWIFLYNKITLKISKNKPKLVPYILTSVIGILIIATSSIGGVRGGFKKTNRPINLVDANTYVNKPQQADLVLNTPFAFLRTLGVKSFKKQDFGISQETIDQKLNTIKIFEGNANQPNIVLIITESLGREYVGSFNKDSNIKNYKGYTPFIDSLAMHSKIFTNAYGNGYKSIHGMSSILSGIPSFKDAFTSSAYVKQDIQSVVSCLKEMGYDTSFFHGAPNGSMGFLGYGNILGFDHYYGKTEYNNDADFDGSWGIWDEPFMQFMNETLSKKQQPFLSTIFTVSSHEPYKVPEKYKGKFPKGDSPMHQCIGYTDYAFKKFFESAKKEDWYKNTIFIITADHCNLINYTEEYSDKIMNRMAVPILIFKPDNSLAEESKDLAQHIDIYPTVLDLAGYNKPFRSWGRSLVSESSSVEPFVMNHNSGIYYYVKGNYFCTFDGTNIVGIYSINDKKQLINLKGKQNPAFKDLEVSCKAFIQDYFNSIIDRKLGKPKIK